MLLYLAKKTYHKSQLHRWLKKKAKFRVQRMLSKDFFFLCMFLANQRFIFCNFLLCCPLQRSARSQVPSQGGNPPGDWQSAVGWGDAGFEPWTAGQQSGMLPLSYHASQCYWKIPVHLRRRICPLFDLRNCSMHLITSCDKDFSQIISR
jgi:hypothetical protein